MPLQWYKNSKGGHSKLEIESLGQEYFEHWLYYIYSNKSINGTFANANNIHIIHYKKNTTK